MAVATAWADSSWWQGVDTSDWYAFNATGTTDPGEIGLANWLGTAGEHGRPLPDGDRFVYNGQPLKFWGFNMPRNNFNVDFAAIDAAAPFYAKYGANLVRFHGFMEHWSPITTDDCFYTLDETGEGLARFDYLMYKLKMNGVYANLGPSWHITISEGNKADIPYWEEFFDSYGGSPTHPKRPFVSTSCGYGSIPAFIYFLDEFKEMKIKQVENILNHVNPHTGVKYADESQVLTVEMHNETSIYHIDSYLKNGWMTTLRERACQQFCD